MQFGESYDFESNPFYAELQKKYASKYKEAEKNLWMICVPATKSLKDLTITKEFIDLHVLKPSPFFKSHYVSTDGNDSITVEIEESILKTPSGDIKILTEETAYNDNFKPFKVILIDRPLMSSAESKVEVHVAKPSEDAFALSFEECKTFLDSLLECQRQMKLLDKQVRAFNCSYILMSEYLEDAVNRIENMRCWAIDEVVRGLSYSSAERSRPKISITIENYIMCNVHDKLFPSIKKHCLEEDKKLTSKLLKLYDVGISPEALGVQETFCCPVPSAVVELASLNSRCCPAEKLHCLMSTLDLLNHDVEKYLTENCFVGNKDTRHLTSDDLIPLLVNVIIQARPQYFVSNLYYIQNFCWEMSAFDKYSFGLVTFQAAKEYVMSHEFKLPEPSAKKVKKELSLEELMEVNVKSSPENKPASNRSPLDHQLQNVTKLIEASTLELQEKEVHDSELPGIEHEFPSLKRRKVDDVNTVEQEEDLGDFITGLREKNLGVSYGKQT